MRKIYLLVLLLGTVLSTSAQDALAVFESQDRSAFYIIIDGKVLNDMPQNRVESPVVSGRRQVRVIFEDPSRGQLLKTFEFYRQMQSNFVIVQAYNKFDLVKKSDFRINQGQNSSYDQVQQNGTSGSVFERNGYYCQSGNVSKAMLIEYKSVYSQMPVAQRDEYLFDKVASNCWYTVQIAELLTIVQDAEQQLELSKVGYVHTVDTENYQLLVNQLPAYKREAFYKFVSSRPKAVSIQPSNNYPSYNNSTQQTSLGVIDDQRLDQAIAQIKAESFSSGKTKICNDVITNNKFTSAQVLKLISVLSFEEDRLNAAKKAYPKTIDQANFSVVYEAFSFPASIDELKKL